MKVREYTWEREMAFPHDFTATIIATITGTFTRGNYHNPPEYPEVEITVKDPSGTDVTDTLNDALVDLIRDEALERESWIDDDYDPREDED